MTETDVRTALRREADRLEHGPLFGPALRARAQAPRARGRWVLWAALVAAAAAVAVVLPGYALPAWQERRPVPASGQYTGWPVRGELAADVALIARAVAAWNGGPVAPKELPHSQVRALYAGSTPAGVVVVLLGRNAVGNLRWAVLATDATSRTVYRDRLHLLSDSAAPDPERAAGLVFTAPHHTTRPTDDRLVVALAAPTAQDFTLRAAEADGDRRPLPSTDGAAVTVAESAGPQSVEIRWQDDGRRSATSHEMFNMFRYIPDPAAVPSSSDAEADCDGGVCTGTASGGIFTATVPDGARTDLRDSGTVGVGEDWEELHETALELARARYLPASSYTASDSWSGLLPDGTGGHLARYSFDGQGRVVLYADRPSAAAGHLVVDLPDDQPLPVVTAVVVGERGRWLLAPAVPGWRVQAQVDGGQLLEATRKGELLYRELPASGRVTVRVLDPQNRVVHDGAPDGDGPLPPPG